MSCYLCEEFDISFLAQYAVDNDLVFRIKELKDLNPKELAERMFNINVASVDSRYPDEDSDTPPFRWSVHGEIVETTPMQVIVTAQHFQYQCFNYDLFDGSPIERLVLYIINHATHNLPGHDDANWGSPPKPKIVKQTINKFY